MLHIRNFLAWSRARLLDLPIWVLNLLSLAFGFLAGQVRCFFSHMPWSTQGVSLYQALIDGELPAIGVVVLLVVLLTGAVAFQVFAYRMQREAIRRELFRETVNGNHQS